MKQNIMKQSIIKSLEVFSANPIEAEQVYRQNWRRWNDSDYKMFWNEAMRDYPHDNLKKTAYRLLEFLAKNDLIKYEEIASEFVDWYENDGAGCDIGLTEFTFRAIAQDGKGWLEESGVDGALELADEVTEAERTCWFWSQLFRYCIEDTEYEYNFVRQVASALR